jgi:hypothetical protein
VLDLLHEVDMIDCKLEDTLDACSSNESTEIKEYFFQSRSIYTI